MNDTHILAPRLRRWSIIGLAVGILVFFLFAILDPGGVFVRAGLALSIVAGGILGCLNWLQIAGYPDIRVPGWLWALPGSGVIIFAVALYLGFLRFAVVIGLGICLIGMIAIAAASWLRHQ